MVRFDWKLSLHFLWKKSTLILGFIKAREGDKKGIVIPFCRVYDISKYNFYGIRQFVDSSLIERRTAGIDPWLLPYTGYDNHTVRTRLLSVRHLRMWDRSQYYWKFSFKICLHGASDNFGIRSFYIQQWKIVLSLNNLNWPYDLIIIEKIT